MILQAMSLGEVIVRLIMNYTTHASLSILWNEKRLEGFHPLEVSDKETRYPLIFLALYECVGSSVDLENLKVVKLSRTGPVLSHLYFAYNLLLFGEATKHQAGVMEGVLRRFCEESEQKVNIGNKSCSFLAI